jgi:hypothetical protein
MVEGGSVMRLSEAEFQLLLSSKEYQPKQRTGHKESDIQKNIKSILEWNGWFVVKIHQSLGSYKGIADLYAIKNGRQVWIEVKTASGIQSEHQLRFQASIEQQGGCYLLARSVEDVKSLCENK